MIIVLVSIGNSDDKLSQARWAAFIHATNRVIADAEPDVHGNWYSLPDVQWQNANWLFEIEPGNVPDLRGNLTELRKRFGQDSIAWSVIEQTEFI